MKVFVDTDVVVSSLLSSSGAAYFLLEHVSDVTLNISKSSLQEIRKVVARLNIAKDKLESLVERRLNVTHTEKTEAIYQEYVFDVDDAHIVVGAKEAKARFLITYNLKDFKIDKIKQDFDIIIITPARFLQYLRGE